MENPNEYDEERYTQFSIDTVNAVTELWEAGARIDDIAATVSDGLGNAGLTVKVSIEVGEA